MSQYPLILNLFGAYLNQDWSEDYDDVWEAVQDYFDQEPSSLEGLMAEVDDLLVSRFEEQLQQMLVADLHSGYSPEFDGYTMRAWVQELRERGSMRLQRQD